MIVAPEAALIDRIMAISDCARHRHPLRLLFKTLEDVVVHAVALMRQDVYAFALAALRLELGNKLQALVDATLEAEEVR